MADLYLDDELTYSEMLKVFNCGYGMLVFINKNDINNLKKLNLDYSIVGSVVYK